MFLGAFLLCQVGVFPDVRGPERQHQRHHASGDDGPGGADVGTLRDLPEQSQRPRDAGGDVGEHQSGGFLPLPSRDGQNHQGGGQAGGPQVVAIAVGSHGHPGVVRYEQSDAPGVCQDRLVDVQTTPAQHAAGQRYDEHRRREERPGHERIRSDVLQRQQQTRSEQARKRDQRQPPPTRGADASRVRDRVPGEGDGGAADDVGVDGGVPTDLRHAPVDALLDAHAAARNLAGIETGTPVADDDGTAAAGRTGRDLGGAAGNVFRDVSDRLPGGLGDVPGHLGGQAGLVLDA